MVRHRIHQTITPGAFRGRHQSESDAFYSNAEGMAVFRRSTELVAVGTHPWDEVEEEAPLELA
jgi:hypothetical protein